jgi:hypothetical protein
VTELADCLFARGDITNLPRYRGNGGRRQIEHDIKTLERTNRFPQPEHLEVFLIASFDCLDGCPDLAKVLARIVLGRGGPSRFRLTPP